MPKRWRPNINLAPTGDAPMWSTKTVESLSVDDVFGMLHNPGQTFVAVEEMNESIAKAVSEHHERVLANL